MSFHTDHRFHLNRRLLIPLSLVVEVDPFRGSPDFKRLRRGKLPTDRALTGRAIDWLLALPPTLRPQSLSLQFPRIINALAEVWHEPEQCQALFDRLLCNGRHGRKGFPISVRDELVALQKWTPVF